MNPNWNDMTAWNLGQPNPNNPGGGPGYPQGGPGYPQGGLGYPQGVPGYPQGGPGYQQGGPSYPQGAPGYPSGGPGQSYGGPGQPYGGYPPQYTGPGPNPNYGQGFGPTQGYPAGGQSYGPGPGQYQPQGGQGLPGGSAQTFPAVGPSGGAQAGDVYDPSLKPKVGFNAEDDCQRLRKAMKGMGTDEKTIIDIMGNRTSDQRVQIVHKFKTMYGKDLISEFKGELSGKFERLVIALCYPPREFLARELRNAMEGAGTNEDTLIEILCSRSNKEIKEIRETYSQVFPGRNLEKDLISETSGHFKRLLVSCAQANRDESQFVDRQAARKDAEALYSAGEKRLGTDESEFNRILCSKSYAHLRQVFQEYQGIAKRSIEKAIKSEFSGDLEDANLAIVECIQNKQKFYATQLHQSMKGAGTRDTKLIRIVVTRSEIDMNRIKREYEAAYQKPLVKAIKDDTSGDYEKLLCLLVGQ